MIAQSKVMRKRAASKGLALRFREKRYNFSVRVKGK